jgi:hypothetical protein
MSYERPINARMAREFAAEPAWAALVAETLQRLNTGFPGYEPALTRAIFQNHFPQISVVDAFAFATVYANLVTGRWRWARIHVGAVPGPDRDQEGNQAKLGGLAGQFQAAFHGGLGDHDGVFSWHDHAHVGGYVIEGSEKVAGPSIALAAWSTMLEVGTQSAAKTLWMLERQQAVARWPYDSEDIWLLCNPAGLPRAVASCIQGTHGWPCAAQVRQ